MSTVKCSGIPKKTRSRSISSAMTPSASFSNYSTLSNGTIKKKRRKSSYVELYQSRKEYEDNMKRKNDEISSSKYSNIYKHNKPSSCNVSIDTGNIIKKNNVKKRKKKKNADVVVIDLDDANSNNNNSNNNNKIGNNYKKKLSNDYINDFKQSFTDISIPTVISHNHVKENDFPQSQSSLQTNIQQPNEHVVKEANTNKVNVNVSVNESRNKQTHNERYTHNTTNTNNTVSTTTYKAQTANTNTNTNTNTISNIKQFTSQLFNTKDHFNPLLTTDNSYSNNMLIQPPINIINSTSKPDVQVDDLIFLIKQKYNLSQSNNTINNYNKAIAKYNARCDNTTQQDVTANTFEEAERLIHDNKRKFSLNKCKHKQREQMPMQRDNKQTRKINYIIDYEINGGQSQKQKMLSQWNINTIGLCGENGNVDNEDNEMYLQQYIRNVLNKKPMYIPNPKKNFTMPANTFENILEQQEANLFTPK